MAAFFRSESFCDGCDAPSCAAGDCITSGGACGARDPKQLRRAVDLGHLAWNRAEVFGLSSRWRRFTTVTKRRDFSSVSRHGVVHTGGMVLWVRNHALPEAGGHRVRCQAAEDEQYPTTLYTCYAHSRMLLFHPALMV